MLSVLEIEACSITYLNKTFARILVVLQKLSKMNSRANQFLFSKHTHSNGGISNPGQLKLR